MIDRTKEDIMQDKRLDKQDERLGAAQTQVQRDVERIKSLEADVAALKSLHEEHEKRLDELGPLHALLEHVNVIKQHFMHLRLMH